MNEMYLNLQRGEEDIQLIVEFTSYNGTKGDPEDPDEIDVFNVREELGEVPIELTEKETQNLRDQIYQELCERRNDRCEYNSDR